MMPGVSDRSFGWQVLARLFSAGRLNDPMLSDQLEMMVDWKPIMKANS